MSDAGSDYGHQEDYEEPLVMEEEPQEENEEMAPEGEALRIINQAENTVRILYVFYTTRLIG
jgi:hypothetical protein